MKNKKMNSSSYTDEQVICILETRDEGYTWDEVTEHFNEVFKDSKSSNAIRKTYNRFQDFDFSEDEMLSNIVKSHTATKSKSKVLKENVLLLNYIGAQKTFLEEFEEIVKNNPIKVHKSLNKKVPKSKSKKQRVVVMHLSDTHFQAMIDSEALGGINKYTSIEEARRLAFFTKEVANYKKEHRKDTELVIALNGDLLQGIIHNMESTPSITSQVACGIHLLSQMISFLSREFKSIRVVCSVGNHARMMHKGNKGRQSQEKWDSFATILHVGLKYSLKMHKNVAFDIPVTPYVYTQILGHNYLFLHSDTVLSTGYPGKSINVSSVKAKINDLKEGIGPIDVVVCGHVHVDTKQILNNGVTLLTNGCMSGVDEFALSIGITKNNPTQQLWEVTKDYAVGDLRSVHLVGADEDSSLDKIIEPFKGKF